MIRGSAKIVLFDARPSATTHGQVEEYTLGDENFALLSVPPGVYHGYMTVSREPALIINFPDQLYDGQDERRIPFDSPDVPYRWRG